MDGFVKSSRGEMRILTGSPLWPIEPVLGLPKERMKRKIAGVCLAPAFTGENSRRGTFYETVIYFSAARATLITPKELA
jgi:hypothetical protein